MAIGGSQMQGCVLAPARGSTRAAALAGERSRESR
eukprot:CAMPEP_0180656426 /NCGR_PEP_ID=MMETSP1037_2-20121125/55848_1 /TAXON_ID=632150 /ORGANISM="Azadinium spinosum, Strain 3D9" /LENGTH=34 /DNA_ID= /DNA_START= /DNA_END= /DNA_ORIENTATION=